MLTAVDIETLQRVHAYVPQFEKFLESKLQTMLSDLPSMNSEKVQVFQGRCLALQELLGEIKAAPGVSANRIAKPQL